MTPKNHTICLWFGKGGCGKSLTSYAISSYLSTKYQTLALDMDGQATLSSALVDEIPSSSLSTYSLLKKEASLDDVVVPTATMFPDKLFLAPASAELNCAETETALNLDRHFLLSDCLEDTEEFQFKIIDTPPNGGICTISSMVAASHIVCPISTEPSCWEQLSAFEELLRQVKRRMNPRLEWLGIVPTRYDGRNNLDREVLESLQQKFGSFCFSPIRSTVRWREVMVSLAPPWKQPSTDYLTLSNQILERIGYGKNEIITQADCCE